MTWLVGNPRFSLVVENRFWLVNGAGPIRPWSDFVGCDRVSRGWEQWGVSRTRLSWPMCWVWGAWFNMAKNVVLLCKVPVDKRCVLSWTVCDYLCWPYCAVFAFFAILNQAPQTQHMGHESLVLETPHCSQPRDTRSHPTKSDHGRIGPAPLTNQNRFSTTNENRGFPTNQVTGFRTN